MEGKAKKNALIMIMIKIKKKILFIVEKFLVIKFFFIEKKIVFVLQN